MADSMKFGHAADRLHLKDAEIRRRFNKALLEFARKVNWSRGAMSYVQNQLYEREEPEVGHSLIGISIPMRELDFAGGNRVYTKTPRLLLKVPGTHREGAQEEPIIHREKGTPDSAILGRDGAPLDENAVLIYPNKEGGQPDAKDRPVVHWNGVCPDDLVIIGRVGVGDEKEEEITSIIASVIGEPPEGESIWQHYENTATIEDLSDILIKLREAGFSNQYNTDADYLESCNSVSKGNADASGLFQRDKDREICSAMFLRGDIRFGYETQEEMGKGGFAVRVILYTANEKGSEYRPVSQAFAKEHYCYELTDAPVTATQPQTLFRGDHELRTHEKAFDKLLDRFAEINQSIRKHYAQEQDTPEPDGVSLQGGQQGETRGREHGR